MPQISNMKSDYDHKTVRLLAIPVKLSAGICILISIGGVLWSCLAKIPIYANGVAILLPTNKSKILLSQAKGTVVYFTDHKVHQNNQTRSLYDFASSHPDLSDVETLALAHYALNLTNNNPSAPLIVASRKRLSNKSLLTMLESDDAKASLKAAIIDAKLVFQQNQAARQELTAIDNKTNRKISLMKKQLAAELKFFKSIQELYAKGYASQARLLSQESIVIGIKNEIISLQDQLEASQLQLVKLDSTSQEAVNTLAKALQKYIGDHLIFSTDNLSVADIISPHLTEVKANEPILRVNVNHNSVERILVIPGYIGEASAQRVLPGMKALMTPVGMSRAQYGGFFGVVQSSSLLPQNQLEILNQLGDPGAANEIVAYVKRPIQVKIKLQQSSNHSDTNKGGFVWSSQGKVPYPVRVGDRLNLQITTQKIRPISLLIPWLKRVIGVSPPVIQGKPLNQ